MGEDACSKSADNFKIGERGVWQLVSPAVEER
jgi:hypothetical protein